MIMDPFIHFNGELLPANTKLVTAGNRGLRYGDGLFETLKVTHGTIALADRHMERLFHGLQVLQIVPPAYLTAQYLQQSIMALCRKNTREQEARVRLSVFRGNGSLYKIEEETPDIVIETDILAESYRQLNEQGLQVDIYEAVKKSCDVLSNLKSNNYLPYVMGALHVKEKGLNDCLLLNSYGRICDATIANVFCITGNTISTPALSEGCVAGVMRAWLTEVLRDAGYEIREQALTIEELLQADEVFLTNALYGIRWVAQIKNKQYNNNIAAQLYNRFLKNRPA